MNSMLKISILIALVSSSIFISFLGEILMRGVPPRVMEQPVKVEDQKNPPVRIKVNNVPKAKFIKMR